MCIWGAYEFKKWVVLYALHGFEKFLNVFFGSKAIRYMFIINICEAGSQVKARICRKSTFLAIFVYVSSFKEFESVSEAINWYRESLYDVFEALKFWSR